MNTLNIITSRLYQFPNNSCIFVPKLIKLIPSSYRNLTLPVLYVNLKSYSTDSSIKPVKKYANADMDKLKIIKENKGKAGVYC